MRFTSIESPASHFGDVGISPTKSWGFPFVRACEPRIILSLMNLAACIFISLGAVFALLVAKILHLWTELRDFLTRA